ncbi:MAG: Uma2 family endonuclease [Archangium sp.]
MTAALYQQLADDGFFATRVELLDGLVLSPPRISPRHAVALANLTQLVTPQLRQPSRAFVRCPLMSSEYSVPEPDYAVVRVPASRRDDFGAGDASLVVEIGDATIRTALGFKRRLYAAAGVPEYWALDLQKQQLVVHRAPKNGRFTVVSRHGKTKTVTSLREPRVTLKISDVLR